jgi:hypothetical protein
MHLSDAPQRRKCAPPGAAACVRGRARGQRVDEAHALEFDRLLDRCRIRAGQRRMALLVGFQAVLGELFAHLLHGRGRSGLARRAFGARAVQLHFGSEGDAPWLGILALGSRRLGAGALAGRLGVGAARNERIRCGVVHLRSRHLQLVRARARDLGAARAHGFFCRTCCSRREAANGAPDCPTDPRQADACTKTRARGWVVLRPIFGRPWQHPATP